MKCKYCFGQNMVKRGKRDGRQQYLCKDCQKHCMESYLIGRMNPGKDAYLIRLHCLGLGTRGIAEALEISHTCVMKTKLRLAAAIPEPELRSGQVYQMDELATFVAWKRKPKRKKGKKHKKDEYYVIHAINAKTGRHAGFVVGKRTKENIAVLAKKLLQNGARRIYTDGLKIYPTLIPKRMHSVFAKCTNRIERFNLTLRTHIKRLSRKTLCFSRSKVMLETDLKLYFRGSQFQVP